MELEKVNMLDISNLDDIKNLNISDNYKNNILTNGIGQIIDSGISYMIKSFPDTNGMKGSLAQIFKEVKNNEWDKVITSSIEIALKEGMSLLGIPKDIMNRLTNIKDMLLSGGIREALAGGFEILIEIATKNRILPFNASKVISLLNEFIFSHKFSDRFSELFDRININKSKLKDNISSWYEAYNNRDFESLNTLTKDINEISKKCSDTKELDQQIIMINNINSLVQSKSNVLNSYELELCNKI